MTYYRVSEARMRVPRARIGRRRFWVPRTVAQLREELRKMGITRINGVPLGRVRKEQLLAVFLAMRERGR